MTESFWCDHIWLNGVWARHVRLTLADGCVASLTHDVAPAPQDERCAVVLPGLPNLHSHAFQRAMAGLTERAGPDGDSFWSWRDLMYRFNARIGPDEMRAIAAMAYVEMLESGFTRVGEFHYLHHAPDGRPYADPAEMAAALCAAADATGIAMTLLPVFYAHAGFGGQAPSPAQARFISDIDGYARLLEASRRHVARLPDGVVGVAPHSLRAVTPDELAALIPLAGQGPIHIHIAEQMREVEDCLAFNHQRPVEWLLDHAPVDARWCLVHATHMTQAETERLAQSGAVAGLCPITEANLGDGLFPAAAYLEAGGAFGIGSDSNVLINAFEELRLLDYGQRLGLRARNVLAAPGQSSGARLFEAVVRGGGRALNAPDALETAALAPGAAADMVTLNATHPALLARSGDEILDAAIFAAASCPVDCVYRRGRKIVSGGRHVARDAVVADYRRALEALRA
ncbi:MAG: formimidoylglutamate deiminase [Asticcacaulis sp.]|uniref:formimidoylglutamate deiminase n=1 Tax=Asticcacaulis sp. TaxID=1872648 RepID=UPI003F7C3AD4